ncbi:MAG: Na+/H+ antiporter subunit E [Candidatus Omnitrophica bacterium]|nr:Na+/H+ antiporter subunit E [Candidatus Omnitrophota bacterium]
MRNRIILFIIGFFIWMLLVWSLDIQHAVIGIFVAAMVAFLTGDMFTKRLHYFAHPVRYFWFLYYVPLFIWECAKANIESTYKVIHPDVPIKPGIVKIKTSLKSDAGLTFLANTLTLKPGTMTIDIDRENGFLYVHWADVASQDVEESTRMLSRRFERILARVFE